MSTDPTCPHLSPLEKLPRDLMWMLLDYAPDVVYCLRATSAMLRFRVFEHATLRFNVPIVRVLRFTSSSMFAMDKNGQEISQMEVQFSVPSNQMDNFELRIVGQSEFDLPSRIKRRSYFAETDLRYFLIVDKSEDIMLLDHLNNAIGMQFDKVEIVDWDNRRHYDTIAKLLERKRFKELEYRFGRLSERVAGQILEHVKNCQVTHIALYGGSLISPCHIGSHTASVGFLLELSTCVRSMRIGQDAVAGLNANHAGLLGVMDYPWAQVILQLFSKKLEKMLIENFYYPEYLSDGADILANNLPFVGKPVWFSASVSHRITPKYIATQNDHVIQAVKSRGGVFFNIMHLSMIEKLSQLEISYHSPFEKIPRELFWKLVEYAPETALKLRAASKTLKLRLEEYTHAHLQESYVEELSFIGGSQILGPTSLSLLPYEAPAPRNHDMEIEITVHEHNSKLFSLRLFQPFLYPRLRKNKYTTDPDYMTFSIELNSKIKQVKLLKYLDNCLGADIRRVVIKEWKRPMNHEVIARLLYGKTAGAMELSLERLTNEAVFKLLMPIGVYKVEVLDLTVDKNETANPEGLLHHLSSIVPALIIRQRHVSGIASTENYFFGVENVRWKPIFVDMLRRKLEKLKIVNFAYKQYLSREHTLDLMEEIPKLDKAIWFNASCTAFESAINNSVNGFSITEELSLFKLMGRFIEDLC